MKISYALLDCFTLDLATYQRFNKKYKFDSKPSADGTVAYLNTGDDLQVVFDKIVANGGEMVVPKTDISPEMGFFAMFIDTEGNKLGLHSMN